MQDKLIDKLPKYLARVVVCAVILTLTPAGCMLLINAHYVSVEAPNAEYLRSACNGTAGFPDIAYYPFHGIFISLQLYPVLIGIHVPDHNVVHLGDDIVVIRGRSPHGLVNMVVHVKVSPHDVFGANWPREFGRMDPFQEGRTTTLGPLEGGGSAYGSYLWYLFVGTNQDKSKAFISAPGDMTTGTITLPSITVNGMRYPRQTLRFVKKAYSGITSVNC